MMFAPAAMHSSADAMISALVTGIAGLARLLKNAPLMVAEIATLFGNVPARHGVDIGEGAACGIDDFRECPTPASSS